MTAIIEAQARRVGRYWDRYYETGEERWLHAATEADRIYCRMVEREREMAGAA